MIGSDMTLRFELFVRDPRRSAEFYSRLLGFTVVEETPQTGGGLYIGLQNGDVNIGVQSATSITKPMLPDFRPQFRVPPMGVELVLEVADVDAYYEHIQREAYPLQSPRRDRSWGESDFRVIDPDGYFLRITSRRTKRYAKEPCYESSA